MLLLDTFGLEHKQGVDISLEILMVRFLVELEAALKIKEFFKKQIPDYTIGQLSGNYSGYTDDFILKDTEKTAGSSLKTAVVVFG